MSLRKILASVEFETHDLCDSGANDLLLSNKARWKLGQENGISIIPMK